MYDGHGFFGAGFMWIFWILLILVIVWAVKAASGSGDAPRDRRTPLEILKERYARGEIDQATFERMKRDLEG